jgi:hypothetical protein
MAGRQQQLGSLKRALRFVEQDGGGLIHNPVPVALVIPKPRQRGGQGMRVAE